MTKTFPGCRYKKIQIVLRTVLMVLGSSIPPASAQTPPSVTSTVAMLRAMPTASAAAHGTMRVLDYYGTRTGCPADYIWNAADTAADNGGGVINPNGNTGAGRWDLSFASNGPIHSCQFGVYADSTPGTGTGTDQSARLQNLLTWASAAGPNRVHIDGTPNKCIAVYKTLTPAQGELIEGDGRSALNGSASTGTCISFLAATGWLFQLQTPYPGHGASAFEAPKFSDMSMFVPATASASGGCVQLNSIAGGFTDDPSSQMSMLNPRFKSIYCVMSAVSTTNIGFQCSKCINGVSDQVTTFGGLNGFDIEGSENFAIRGGTVNLTYGPMIKLVARNSFGNNDEVTDMQLLSLQSHGQTVDSMLYDAARSSTIINIFFENLGSTAIARSAIHLDNGLTAGIYNNVITVPSTVPWLLVDKPYNNITAYGNGSYGGPIGAAVFHNGNSLYNASVVQTLSHHGNGANGDSGWPFNTKLALEQPLSPKTEAIWSPDYAGLTGSGWGPSEIPVNSTFTFPITGAGNYLEFSYDRLPPPTGTFDLQIHAWQTRGAGQLTCQLEDGGTPVGSALSARLTASPAWYTLTFVQPISTYAGVRCWNSGTGAASNPAMVNLINLVDH